MRSAWLSSSGHATCLLPFAHVLFEEGVIVRSLGKGMAVSPPLVAEEAELDRLLKN
ncbi:hypothetical protein [Amycolatopsis circi]|uniref:hypothetical protein n=1 Tax=Amycolatopsis circi TaxID=871959 RepID=UPI0013BE9230|nr:hypothetical protein [Amycolatopsis circi]